MPNNVPLRILAATEQNNVYRKPNIGMFQAITEIYRTRGLEIDMEKSIFVGDAAGRSAKGSRKKDHGNTDYKFAINVGLRFVTPEVRPCHIFFVLRNGQRLTLYCYNVVIQRNIS